MMSGWLDKYQNGGVIEDNRGQWAHPGKITKINSNDITMEGVNYPVLGISDTGDAQLMQPGGNYHFKGKSVVEVPIKAQKGVREYQEIAQDNTYVAPRQTVDMDKLKPLQYTDQVEVPYRGIEDSDCDGTEGCVTGAMKDITRTLGVSTKAFRKANNAYGDAWAIMDNTYGEFIPFETGNYDNIRPGDMVSLSRDPYASDKENNIPDKEQHLGIVTKKNEEGVPMVRHWIGTENQYYEEPINNISQFNTYTPSRVKRPDSLSDIDINREKMSLNREDKLPQQKLVVSTLNRDKENIQKQLRLNSNEYDRLSALAYGIIGTESDFGGSKRTAARMLIPDAAMQLYKVSQDNFNKDYNPLSKGYSSVKSSKLFNISDNRSEELKAIQRKIGFTGSDVDGIWGEDTEEGIKEWNESNPNDQLNFKSLKEKLNTQDYKDLSKTQNYIHNAFSALNIDMEKLERPGEAAKATIAILSQELKRNPDITDEELLKKYTGKTNIKSYYEKTKSYMNDLDDDLSNNRVMDFTDKVFAGISFGANFANENIKYLKDKAVDFISKNSKIIPINFRALGTNVVGADTTITEDHLSKSAKERLSDIVRNNVGNGKFSIEYGDYGTEQYGDVGGDSEKGTWDKIKAALTNEGSILKQFLGQAAIIQVGENEYEVIDIYDFNNQGESFGVLDDVAKKGADPYNIVRSIGTNYGKANNLGNKVRIRIEI
jgi:hypothetical protein